MRITRLRIQNFRSVRSLDLALSDMTVFIGTNNAGKTAIMEAVRIALTRRWGQRGTGFTEHDVHRPEEHGDPRTLPPVQIEITLEEPSVSLWDPDMVARLDDVMSMLPDGRNILTMRVTCAWDEDKEDFIPAWEFLDHAGVPMTGPKRRAENFNGFFQYLPLFWLDALRDAATEFKPRSEYWGKLLRGVRIPDALETEVKDALSNLDSKIIAADPRLADIAEMIGQATHVALGESPGGARLNTMPLTIEEMLQRAGVVLRNENLRPWLPLGHHGQGLQSLAVIFLFQAAVLQRLKESGRPGMDAVFAIEEPEVHLHPQAARSLWQRIQGLKGQVLLTTHSPYFVQHVPLHDLRLVRLVGGCTEVASIPRRIGSTLPWTNPVEQLSQHAGTGILQKDPSTGCVAAACPIPEEIAEKLTGCYSGDPDAPAKASAVDEIRYASRVLVSPGEEAELGFHGRRVRGEVFFARRWVLVEGVCEYMLLHAIGIALGWPLDPHGISVIDFQQSGNGPGVFAALAEAFRIPWHMIVDGDPGGEALRKQLVRRGFRATDLNGHFDSMTPPNNLEAQLLADGHEALLRDVLFEIRGATAKTCTVDELKTFLKNEKTEYMSRLALRVAAEPALAARMPGPFVRLMTGLRDGTI